MSSKGETRNPKLVELYKEDPEVRCDFCNRSAVNTLMWGQMYRLEGLVIHYFCLIFSASLSQSGEDDEGILGFMPQDIHKELIRGTKLRCKYCRQTRATIGCSVKTCQTSFHYTCGLENGSLFQFIGNYEAYCIRHRTETVVKNVHKGLWECPICYMDFSNEKYPIKSPCCNGVFHRKCMMEMARNTGSHFFKCPLCNDTNSFCDAMRMGGVYVPERDAAWELEPNAFSDLYQQYNRCDAEPCICPGGRKYNSENKDDNKWKLVRCKGCGASAKHTRCGSLKNEYKCHDCSTVLTAPKLQHQEMRNENLNDDGWPESATTITNCVDSHTDSKSDYGEASVADTLENPISTKILVDKKEKDTQLLESESGTQVSFHESIAGISQMSNYPFTYPTIYGRRYKAVGVEFINEDDSDTSESAYESEDNEVAKIPPSVSDDMKQDTKVQIHFEKDSKSRHSMPNLLNPANETVGSQLSDEFSKRVVKVKYSRSKKSNSFKKTATTQHRYPTRSSKSESAIINKTELNLQGSQYVKQSSECESDMLPTSEMRLKQNHIEMCSYSNCVEVESEKTQLNDWNQSTKPKSMNSTTFSKSGSTGNFLQNIESKYVKQSAVKKTELNMEQSHPKKRKRSGTKISDQVDLDNIELPSSSRCPKCYKFYSYPCRLKRHILNCKESNKELKCPICPAFYYDRLQILLHINSTHEQDLEQAIKLLQ